MKNLPLDDESTGSKTTKSLLLTLLVFISPLALAAQNGNSSGVDQETMVLFLALIVVTIAVLVLMVAIYTLSVLRMTLDQDSPESQSEPDKQWKWFWERFNKSVAPEQEKSILLDHNYDGIRELDNHLPPWWTALFYIGIAIGVIYMFVYHVFNLAPLPGELYDISVAQAKTEAAARLAAAGEEGGGIDESTVTFSDDQAIIDSGKKIYDMQCASCHRNDGGGNIGPNLTDAYWLHGGSISDIYSTIKYGVPQKGMIPWEPLLSPEQMRDVSSYIMTMAGSDPANAKAPQGDLFEGDEAGSDTQEVVTEESEA